MAYQVIWVKFLSQIFGHTIYAVSTVVAAFMAGMAIGSLTLGRFADRVKSPLKLYAFLELGIGVYAIFFLLLFSFLNDVYAGIFSFLDLQYSTFSFGRILYAFVLLIIPTALIGGTFPVISKYYIRDLGQIRNRLGVLYASNTFGAVVGALLTGFILLEWLGISATLYLMVCINIILALIALLLSRGESYDITRQEESIAVKKINFILIIYAISGFVSLSLEVLWTRELAIVFLSSTYSFSTVLVTFLIGLGAGSLFFRWKKNVKNPIQLFYRIEFGIAILALSSIPMLRLFPQELYIDSVMTNALTWQIELFLNFGIAFLILILPTFLMGAAFPLVCSIYVNSVEKIGNDIGSVYAYNTMGAIFGSLIAGFVLIPVFGVLTSIIIISCLSFGIVLALLLKYQSFKKNRLEFSVMTGIFAVLFLTIIYNGGNFRPLPTGMKVLYSKEDISAEVKVLEDEKGDRSLYINEKQQGGTRVAQTERWTGQVPLVFHQNPDSVLLIGLGTGVTLNAVAEGPVEHITCVDLIGSLVETAEQFESINGGILKNEQKVSFIEADGINYLSLTRNKFDLVICDIVHPDDAGAGDLFSLEFYKSCKTGLKDEGLFVQWILLDQLAPDDLKTILATFYYVFPNMQLYLGQEQNKYQKLMLLGSANSVKVNFEKISENLKKLPFTEEFYGKDDPYSFLSYFINTGKSLEFRLHSIPINTRDHPIIEYKSPKHRWIPGKSVRNLVYLNGLRESISNQDWLEGGVISEYNTYFNTRTLLINGRLQEYTLKYGAADTSFSEAALKDVDTLLVSHLLENIAWKFIEVNQLDKAVIAFKKSIAVNNYNTKASYALAVLLENMKNEEEAIEFYRYTAHYDSRDYNAERRLGDIYSRRKDFETALNYYRMSLSKNTDQPLLFYILGQIYYNYKNDYVRALEYYRKSLDLEPFHKYSQLAGEAIKQIERNIQSSREQAKKPIHQ